MITGTNNTVTSAGHSAPGAAAQCGGSITLTNPYINTGGGASFGVHALSNASITLTGGSITTSAAYTQSDAVRADGQAASVTATGVVMTANSAAASGANARNAGSIFIHGGSISNPNAAGAGSLAALGSGARITADQGLQITTSGVGAWAGAPPYGGSPEPGGWIGLDNVSINDFAGSSYVSGIRADGVDSTVTPNKISTVTANNTSIAISSDYPDGAALALNGGYVNISNSSITTSGLWAFGLHTSGVASAASPPVLAQTDAANVTIETSGNLAHGVYAHNGALVNLNTVDIKTSGQSAWGLTAEGYLAYAGSPPVQTQINGTGVTVHTTGNYSNGAHITMSSTLDLTGSTITAIGADAAGVYAASTGSAATLRSTTVTSGQQNAVIIANSAHFAATGSTLKGNSLGVLSAGGTAVDPNVISVSGGSLQSVSGDAFNASNTVAQITLKNGTAVTAGSGNLLNTVSVASVSNVTFSVQSITATGNIIADAASTATVDLSASTTVTGIQTNTYTTIESGSKWIMNGNSNIHSLTNKGNATFYPTGSHKTLTAGSYVGNNGVLGINTYFDGSGGGSSDVLVIKAGGSATGAAGATKIVINPTGPGSNTGTNDGILVVRAEGNATVDKASFAYVPIIRGGYQYDLFQGRITDPTANTQNLYLRSKIAPAATSATAIPTLNPAVLALLALALTAMVFWQSRRSVRMRHPSR